MVQNPKKSAPIHRETLRPTETTLTSRAPFLIDLQSACRGATAAACGTITGKHARSRRGYLLGIQDHLSRAPERDCSCAHYSYPLRAGRALDQRVMWAS